MLYVKTNKNVYISTSQAHCCNKKRVRIRKKLEKSETRENRETVKKETRRRVYSIQQPEMNIPEYNAEGFLV